MEPGRVRYLTRQFNNENTANPKVGKPIIKPMEQTRKAFGEVGNKITLPSAQNAKKGLLSQKPVLKPSNTNFTKPNNVKAKVDTNLKPSVPIKTTLPTKKTTAVKAQVQQPKVVPKVGISTGNIVTKPKSKSITEKENKPEKKSDEKIEIKQEAVVRPLQVPDIDASGNCLVVPEYIEDIIIYLMELERKFPIAEKYLTPDHNTTPSMRSVLVNWLCEVHCDFQCLTETFHITVGIIDQYLMKNKNIGRESLQLVGVTAIFLASKYEEMYLNMDISDLAYISDGSCTKKQILNMECAILKSLNFNMGRPMSISFLRRYSKVGNVTPEQHTLSKYLLELALIEYNICHIYPSLQAAAACCLSMALLKNTANPEDNWTTTLVYYTKYKYEEIYPVMCELAQALLRAEHSKMTAIKEKYDKPNQGRISSHECRKSSLVIKLAKQAKLLKQ